MTTTAETIYINLLCAALELAEGAYHELESMSRAKYYNRDVKRNLRLAVAQSSKVNDKAQNKQELADADTINRLTQHLHQIAFWSST